MVMLLWQKDTDKTLRIEDLNLQVLQLVNKQENTAAQFQQQITFLEEQVFSLSQDRENESENYEHSLDNICELSTDGNAEDQPEELQ